MKIYCNKSEPKITMEFCLPESRILLQMFSFVEGLYGKSFLLVQFHPVLCAEIVH